MQQRKIVPTRCVEGSDQMLVQQFISGNQYAFTTLMDRYRPLLYRFIYRHLGEYDQVCDVVQQVFLQLYISLPSLTSVEMLKPWLFRVAHNRCLDELRKKRRRRVTHFSELEWQSDDEEWSPLMTLPDSRPLPEELAEYHDLQRTLLQAIQALPQKFRSIVLLRYMDQLSFAEIGQLLSMPESTVKTYYYRACSRLRSILAL
ncbi:MAG TPA: RNA polymerase sigma factor [Ktedonobacteraceae bacterium]|jgi:RNA polymerase sigma-70 factor (ECF subfamily)